MDSNHRPSPYEGAALTNWATSGKFCSIFRELINSWGLPQNAKISRWRNLTFQILVSKRVSENCCTHLVVAPSGLEPESPTWKADELNLLFYGAKLVAGVGFEPTTHRLWACWATTALPRDKKFQDASVFVTSKMVKKLNCSLHLFNDAEAISSFATEFHHLWTPTVLTHCSDNGNRTRTLSRYRWACFQLHHAIRVFSSGSGSRTQYLRGYGPRMVYPFHSPAIWVSRASRIRTCDLLLPKQSLYLTEL